MGKADFE